MMANTEIAQKPSNNYIIWLDNAKIISIVAVVVGHLTSLLMDVNEIGSSNWWYGNVMRSLINWCVPVFVMVSGALLLDSKRNEDINIFYKKRVSKILIPLLFWTVFYTLVAMKYGYFGDFNQPSTREVLKHLVTGTPYGHMWFLYMIIGLYIFTPFFRKVVANSSRSDQILLVAVSIGVAMLSAGYSELVYGADPGSILFITRFLPYVPYFFAGYLISSSDFNPKKPVLWIVFIASVILTFLGSYFAMVYRGVNNGEYFHHALSISVVPLSLSFMLILKSWSKPIVNIQFTKTINSLTLGVYLVHPLIMGILLFYFHGTSKFQPIIFVLLFTFVIYIISLFVTWCISKVPILNRIT